MSRRAIVIGSGVAGLTAACKLASAHYDVVVYERSSELGGKLRSFNLGGYRFDYGPSLFTLPNYVEEVFEACGHSLKDFLEYKKLDPVCTYFWADGTKLQAKAEPKAFAQEVENVLGVDSRVVLDALDDAETKYRLTEEIFLKRPVSSLSDIASKESLAAILQLHKLEIFTSLNKRNIKALKHPKLIQLWNRYATYNGSDPYQTSGVMASIPHLEHNLGAFGPNGGMVAIRDAFIQLAETLGVQLKTNAEITEIHKEENIITGITVDSTFQAADIVICNADVSFVYDSLFKNNRILKKIHAQEKSSSAMIFYWGINTTFNQLSSHNIIFSNDYEREFQSIFKTKETPEEPTIYINISSKYNPNDAPEGCENWFVMINTPPHKNQDWTTVQKRVKAFLIQRINSTLHTSIEDHIVQERIHSPLTIQDDTRSHVGALYGTSSNSMMSAFRRHPNKSKLYKKLYFCGGSVHPGGGLPLCIQSGLIASRLALTEA